VGKEMKLHVYYSTEESAPIPVLLHADFVVKSDRTKVVSVEASPFNAWIAGRLAEHIVDSVNSWYSETHKDESNPFLFAKTQINPSRTFRTTSKIPNG